MARDIQIEVDVKPVLDTRATKETKEALEKELRSMKSGQHLSAVKKASSVMKQLVLSGQASTPNQARMILSDEMGGSFSPLAKSVLRKAQNITSVELSAEKLKKREELLIGSFSARAASLQNQYSAFQNAPTAEIATGLLTGIIGIRRELLKLYQEYRVNRRQVPPILRQIAQNTSSMRREVSDFESKQESPSGNNNLLIFAKKLAGITTLAGTAAMFAKKGIQAAGLALQRGAQAMRLQAAYGKDVNWGDVRARAGIFNMSEETASSTSRFASDFQQRMMWGEVSEREIIGLSRAGRWGRMVMSGEAARNPLAANQAFEELVATTDRAKMRSILRQLGLSEELMQYNIQGYDKGAREELNKKFADIAEKEWQAAVMMYDAGNQLQVFGEQVSEALAYTAAQGVQYASPQGRAFAHRMGVNTVTEGDVYKARRSADNAIMSGITGIGTLYTPLKTMIETVAKNPTNVNQTVNNNIVIQGNADSNTVDALRDEMSRPQAISSWFEQAQIMGGRTTY